MDSKILRIKELLRNARLILHEDGFLPLLKLFFFTHATYLVFENSLDGPRFPCKMDNMTLRIITCPEELDQLSAQGFNFLEYTETIPSNQTLFLAFVGKEVAHGTRIFHDKTEAYAHFCSISTDDEHTAYMSGIWTAPKYRRKGINAFVSSEISGYLRDKGMARAMVIASKGNIAEENCQLKLGSYLWGEVHHLRFLLLLNFKRVKPKSRATSIQVEVS